MKRLTAIALAVLLCWSAAAQRIRDVDILVELQQDGSAWITQTWDVKTVSGTEWYMPIDNLGPMSVSSLSVTENGTQFQSLGNNWDVDRSFEWKSGKCGIVQKSDGVELCWGLGWHGDHKWTARFLVTGLVQAFDDADGFNFMFINPGLLAAPEHAKVTIVPAFDCPQWTYDNTRVWGFGFYGDINVVDGKVVAESSESSSYNSKLIALVKFEKGLFSPAVTRGGDFQTFLDRALEGSSYGEDEKFSWIIGLLSFLLVFGPILYGIYAWIASTLGYKYKKSLFGRSRITDWYRDVPLEKNLFASAFLLAKGHRFKLATSPNNVIGAFFLRWIMDGKVKVMPDAKSEKRVNLLFSKDVSFTDDLEKDLYNMALSAAGDNLLLETNEFEKWSKKNYNKLLAWPDRAYARGRSWFRDKGYFLKDDVCNTEGAIQACHVIEFKNFLNDFTLSKERGAIEVGMWKDYLVYAQLFNIADKVAAQFKKLYPAQLQELSESVGVDTSTLIYTMNWTGRMSNGAFTSAASHAAGSISGKGGHTSFGGGGGFSGGGFGGGTR